VKDANLNELCFQICSILEEAKAGRQKKINDCQKMKGCIDRREDFYSNESILYDITMMPTCYSIC
jgi:hypothetical protein